MYVRYIYVEAKEKGMPTMFEASSIGNFKLKAATVATTTRRAAAAVPRLAAAAQISLAESH